MKPDHHTAPEQSRNTRAGLWIPVPVLPEKRQPLPAGGKQVLKRHSKLFSQGNYRKLLEVSHLLALKGHALFSKTYRKAFSKTERFSLHLPVLWPDSRRLTQKTHGVEEWDGPVALE